jgi:hypothetical protein
MKTTSMIKKYNKYKITRVDKEDKEITTITLGRYTHIHRIYNDRTAYMIYYII